MRDHRFLDLLATADEIASGALLPEPLLPERLDAVVDAIVVPETADLRLLQSEVLR